MCPVGSYLSPSNRSCSLCPENSVSEAEGQAQCTCIDGYYKELMGEEDLPCRCKFVHVDLDTVVHGLVLSYLV